MRQTFEIPLDIPDVTIENVTTNRMGHIESTVKSTVEGTPCHRCGKMTTQLYGEDREITGRHLPILGRKTFIHLRPKRSQCLHGHGNPTTTHTLSWYTPRSSVTQAYEKQILLSLVNSTMQDTSIKEDIGYEAMRGIIDRYIERDIHWDDVPRFEVSGLDEISWKKGHRDLVAILTGCRATEMVIVGVLPDRKKATVKALLSGIPQRVRQMIHSVCPDRYEGVVQAAKEVFGKRVTIVMDHFHGAKLYRRSLDSFRKHELRRLKKAVSEEASGQVHGAMWALRQAEAPLTDEDKDVLIPLFEHSPCLKMAEEFCHEFTAILNTQLSQREGKRQMRKWRQKGRAST